MLRMVTSLERASPATSMLIHMDADQVVELLVIYIESGCPAVAVRATVPDCIVPRILE